jgi:DNA-directed RNA polymerase subunit RPC12/RpoP
MKKLAGMFLVIVVLAAFAFGCARIMRKDTTVRCPRCGATFTIEEEMHMKRISE